MFKAYGIFDSFLTEKYFFFKTTLLFWFCELLSSTDTIAQLSDFRFSFLEIADFEQSRARVFVGYILELS